MTDQVNFDELLLRRDLRELFENAEFTEALICHYYPQYKPEDVREMSVGDSKSLLNAMRALEIARAVQNLQNAAAAQSKSGFQKVMDQYQRQLKELRG